MAEKKEKKLVAASENAAAKKRETITTPSGYTAKAAKPGGLVYRIPAVCSVTLGTGTTPLIMTRFPVSQLGEESTYITK